MQPQQFTTLGTTSADTGVSLNPEAPTAGTVKVPQAPVGSYAQPGYSPTSTPGFGKISPSGTGLPEQGQDSAPPSPPPWATLKAKKGQAAMAMMKQ
jgi:hypothetical protein